MIEKKDWENALKQYEALYINQSVNIEAYKLMMEVCKEKILEFKDETKDDPMPEDLKEMLK